MWVLDLDAKLPEPLHAGVQRLGTVEPAQKQTNEATAGDRLGVSRGVDSKAVEVQQRTGQHRSHLLGALQQASPPTWRWHSSARALRPDT